MGRQVWVVAPDVEITDAVVAAAADAGAPEIVQGVPAALADDVPVPQPGFPFLLVVPDPPVPVPPPPPPVVPDLARIKVLADQVSLTADEQSEAVLLLLRRFV